MAQVKVSIGGRSYDLACHPGEESHISLLASRVDAKAQQAGQAVTGMNEVRQLLLAALLLADDIEQGASAPPPPAEPAADPEMATAIDRMADRLERLADRLEKAAIAS